MSRVRPPVVDMTGASKPTWVAHWGACMGSQGVRLGEGGGQVQGRDWSMGVWLAPVKNSNNAYRV